MIVKNIVMPKLGESVIEGTIIKWLVAVGDSIKKYDLIAEVESDKVSTEIPSLFSGTITELVASIGVPVPVDEVICCIEVADTTTDTTNDALSISTHMNTEHSEKNVIPIEKTKSLDNISHAKKRLSPAVRALIVKHNIDISQIEGHGKNNRITRQDIEYAIQNGTIMQQKENIAVDMKKTMHTTIHYESSHKADSLSDTNAIIPITSTRRAIAKKMTQSVHEIPHAWLTIELDATNLITYRNKIKHEFQKKEQYTLSIIPFFLKAVAIALQKYPQLNATWTKDAIIHKKEINLNVAMATQDNLYVPVIQSVDEKSIKKIAYDMHILIDKMKSNTLHMSDMEGGTFTVNNTGSFGSIMSMGIINYPQVGILQLERIVKRPVYYKGGFIPRDIMNLCLSIDHRVLDGLIAGQFLHHIQQTIEKIDEDYSIY